MLAVLFIIAGVNVVSCLWEIQEESPLYNIKQGDPCVVGASDGASES